MPNAAFLRDEADETYRDEPRDGRKVPRAPKSFLYLVLEADRPLAGGARFSLDGVDEVLVVRGPERAAKRERLAGCNRLTLSVPARSLSSVHARVRATAEGWMLEDAGSTNGTYLNGARVTSALLRPGDILEMGHAFFSVRATRLAIDDPRQDLSSCDAELEAPTLATLLPEVESEFDKLKRVAQSNIPITLVGETGTGKELLARAIHELSGRSGPFVAFNCAALTANLAESQLFGHVRGAFSGSVADAPGFARAAHTGTLLLDEVKELPLSTQAALLRVLQEHEVIPVGASRPQIVDVRFVATCPYSLERAVQAGQFRSDLFARLSGFIFRLPTLRERREDLGLLISALLLKAGADKRRSLSVAPEFALRLLRYDWPLNIRELELLLARAFVLADHTLDLEQISAALEDPADGREAPNVTRPALSAADEELRKRLVLELENAAGNVAEVARAFRKAPVQVHRWMKRLAVDPAAFRPAKAPDRRDGR